MILRRAAARPRGATNPAPRSTRSSPCTVVTVTRRWSPAVTCTRRGRASTCSSSTIPSPCGAQKRCITVFTTLAELGVWNLNCYKKLKNKSTTGNSSTVYRGLLWAESDFVCPRRLLVSLLGGFLLIFFFTGGSSIKSGQGCYPYPSIRALHLKFHRNYCSYCLNFSALAGFSKTKSFFFS